MQQLKRAQTETTICLEDHDFGNKQAPIGDDDIASSITLTGQAVIKQAREIAKQYISEQSGVTDPKLLETVATYGDTDSYAADTKITTNHGVMQADELYELYVKTAHIDQHGHEIYSVEDKNLQVTTFDSNTNKIVFGRVKNLVRHKVTKRKFIIKAGGNSITMTEDHGCMVIRGGILTRVRPEEIKSGDKMIVSV